MTDLGQLCNFGCGVKSSTSANQCGLHVAVNVD